MDKNSQINLVLNRPATNEVTINLAHVFHNMKVKSRVYAWVLLLCMLVGLCAPLVMYQFNQPTLTVSSVVTLNYEAPVKVENAEGEMVVPEDPEYQKVQDLSAPDGSDLDLTQITSAYVLQNALSGMNLSYTPSVSGLRDNISVERILTEESYRNQELLNQMVENKSADMYEQYREMQITYTNRFIVSLQNGFGETGSNARHFLEETELKDLLNRILSAYNDYLVRTWADRKLPEDRMAVIDVENLDILENLESLRAASEDLYTYCSEKSDSVRAYRSWRDGQNLEDWMQYIRNNQENTIDYLYAYVFASRYAEDKDTLIAGYQYQLREALSSLETVQGNIEYASSVLAAYKNDEILLPAVASEEENAQMTTATATTEYYNALYLQQMKDLETAEGLETKIAELEHQIANLSGESGESTLSREDMTAELNQAIESFRSIYDQVVAHMEEIQQSGFYTLYAEHTDAMGRLDGFLKANLRKMVIGAVIGAVLACGLWFLAGLAPEFRRNQEQLDRKEAQKA